MCAAFTVANFQQQRIIRRFKLAGATAPHRAIDPAIHHIRQSLVFHQLVKDKVLVHVEGSQFYLDETRATAYSQKGLQGIILLLIVVVIVLALLAYFLID